VDNSQMLNLNLIDLFELGFCGSLTEQF